jgi:hypothetical protein
MAGIDPPFNARGCHRRQIMILRESSVEHDLFGKPASTFPDHAQCPRPPRSKYRRAGIFLPPPTR